MNYHHHTDLVEEEVVDVIGEEGSELALLGLAGAHVHLYLLDEPGGSQTQTNITMASTQTNQNHLEIEAISPPLLFQ